MNHSQTQWIIKGKYVKFVSATLELTHKRKIHINKKSFVPYWSKTRFPDYRFAYDC